METITITIQPQSKLPDGYASWSDYLADTNIFLLGDDDFCPEVEFHIIDVLNNKEVTND